MCRVERKRHRATSVAGVGFEQPAHLRVAVVCALGLGCLEPVGKRKGCITRSIERVLWNQYCMIVLSVVWGGRAVPRYYASPVGCYENSPM